MDPPPQQVLHWGVADLRDRNTAVVCLVRRVRAAAARRVRCSAVYQHVRGQAARRRPARFRARRRGGGTHGRQEGWQRVRKRRQSTILSYYIIIIVYDAPNLAVQHNNITY